MTTSVPLADGRDPYADRRVYARTELDLPAFLQANGTRHSAHLLDLSAGGAKLKCPVSIAVGTAVTLNCGTLGRSAVVRWQNDGVLGLCFERPLDVRDVTNLIDRSKALAAWMNARK
jgi:hypothetical protein